MLAATLVNLRNPRIIGQFCTREPGEGSWGVLSLHYQSWL